MKTRHKRLLLILAGLAVLGAVAALVLNAFQSNLVFFFSPTQVAAGEAPKGKPFRIGGMVKDGTIQREADGVTLRFVITDTEKDIVVAYKGILPDLFQEGKGAVAQGRLGDDGVFDGVCRQLGLVRVRSIEELMFTAALLEKTGVLQGEDEFLVIGGVVDVALSTI